MRAMLVIAAICVGGVSWSQEVPVAGASTRQHRLKVAANPAMDYSNATVDAILRRMTEIARRSEFAWDVPCERVEFVRDGDLLAKSSLPLSGTADELAEAMKAVVPSANVLVVSQITDCSGGPAAGCAPLRLDKRDSMAVAHDGSSRGPVIWLHERGHVIGLGHVAQDQMPHEVVETISGQLMYWYPSTNSTGLLQPTCTQFRAASPSAVLVPAAPGAPVGGGTIVAQAEAPPADAVQTLLSRPWLHGVPIAEIDRLNDADLDQIEQIVAGPATATTRQLLLILSYRRPDREQTLKLLQDHATRQIPSAPTQDEAALERRREQIAARLGAVFALGVAGARAQNATAAITTVGNLMQPRAVPVTGQLDISTDINRTALDAAAVIAGRGADQLSDEARAGLLRISPVLLGGSRVAVGGIRRLRPEEERRIGKIRDSVLQRGVAAYLSGSRGR